jgi:DNA-binding response OmpR family regulator
MNNTANSGQATLRGHHVMLVEDETSLSFLVEDMLMELGAAKVSHAATVSAALDLLKTITPTIAVLDVNLGGEAGYPVAEQVAARNIPFLFLTGYGAGGIDPRWAVRPVLQKPLDLDSLERVLRMTLIRAHHPSPA